VSKTRCKSNRNEMKENSCRTVGRCSLKCLKLDDESGWMRHSAHSYPVPEAHEELTTSAHNDALKHLKHDASRPAVLGRRTSGGLAAVSQQSRSTAWSLTRRLKHSVAGWASTWDRR
jgi:hypothetical protein